MKIRKNIPLSNFTTFRIGGPAKFFVEVESEKELSEVLDYAQKKGLKFFILGGGSNLLVSDKGFNGLVIKLRITDCKLNGNIIKAGAGTPLALLVNLAAQNNLTGMEWAAGIPGTVGGALRGNAGAFGGHTGNVVSLVNVLDAQNMSKVVYKREECKFNYRHSLFKERPNLIILSALFELRTGDFQTIKNKIKEIMTKRITGHPKGSSAGSYFINPVVRDAKIRSDFEKDTGMKPKDDRLPAGWFIDKLDLRGKRIGDAMIAREHANWIVNVGSAKSEDIIILASIVKQQVRDKFGVELFEETHYLDF